MKSFSLAKQLIIGFLLSIFASISIHSFSLLFSFNDAFNLGLLITSILYICLILTNSQTKTGRVSVFVIAVLGAIMMQAFVVSSELILVLSLVSILFVRIVYNPAGLLGAAYYAILICFGFFIASGVLVSTNSWFLGFWCFFFVQSFAVYSQNFSTGKDKHEVELNCQQKTNHKFNTARNIANQAIHQLSTH